MNYNSIPVWSNKVWIACLLLLSLHQFIQKVLCWDLGFIDHYLDPFLGMPCLLGLMLQERRFLIDKYFKAFKPTHYHFSILEIFVTTACFAILFEEGFSRWSAHFTKDYYDYLAYAGGAFIFYYFINE